MFARLFLEGTGAASLAWLGALGAIISAGGVSSTPRVACFSMGSLIAAALALGAPPDRILDVVCACPLAGTTNATLVLRMLTWRGRASTMRAIRRIALALGVTRRLTLGALRARTGWDLAILVASLRSRSTHVLDADTAPGARVLDAILASCSVPGMLNTGSLVDGGTFGGFADTGMLPGPDSLVLSTRVLRIYQPVEHPGTRLLASYRTLLCKVRSRWVRAARARGATVLSMPRGAPLSADPARIRLIYACSRDWATRLVHGPPKDQRDQPDHYQRSTPAPPPIETAEPRRDERGEHLAR